MKIDMIRHGQVPGNREHRYVGITEEHLTEEGRKQAEEKRLSQPQTVFTSPRIRCIETAQILYPGCEPVVIPELSECDFGAFEYKNYKELTGNPDYQAWIDSGGTIGFPGGEDRKTYQERSLRGFRKAMEILAEKSPKGETEEMSVAEKDLKGETECLSGTEEQPEAGGGTGGIARAAFVVHGGTIMAVLSELAEPAEDYFHWQCGNAEGFTGEWTGGHIRNINKI